MGGHCILRRPRPHTSRTSSTGSAHGTSTSASASGDGMHTSSDNVGDMSVVLSTSVFLSCSGRGHRDCSTGTGSGTSTRADHRRFLQDPLRWWRRQLHFPHRARLCLCLCKVARSAILLLLLFLRTSSAHLYWPLPRSRARCSPAPGHRSSRPLKCRSQNRRGLGRHFQQRLLCQPSCLLCRSGDCTGLCRRAVLAWRS